MYGSIDASLKFFSRLKAIVPICAIPYAALNMESTFSVLVDYLGIEISEKILLDIRRKLSREALAGYVNSLDWRSADHVERRDGYIFDKYTLLHRNHFTYAEEDRSLDHVAVTEDAYGSHANEIFKVDFARIER